MNDPNPFAPSLIRREFQIGASFEFEDKDFVHRLMVPPKHTVQFTPMNIAAMTLPGHDQPRRAYRERHKSMWRSSTMLCDCGHLVKDHPWLSYNRRGKCNKCACSSPVGHWSAQALRMLNLST